MRKPSSAILALVVSFLFSAQAFAQEQARDFSAQTARKYRAPSGGVLTPPSPNPPPQVVADFLASRGHDPATRASLVLERENLVARTSVVHLQFTQEVNGLAVYGTYVKASITSRGEIVDVVENLEPIRPAPIVPATINARAALVAVLQRYYPGATGAFDEIETVGNTTTFSANGLFSPNPSATRVAVPMANGALHVGFRVETWDRENILRHTVVGRAGNILVEELRTSADSYKIFPDHPGNSTQIVVSGAGAGNPESQQGWVFSNTTTGNNVDAYLDRDNNNAADTNGRPVSDTRQFVDTADLTQSPTLAVNQRVAVQNLFYFNNVIHDKLYRHGFTEAAGNFQENNFGQGGSGSDSVNAEAQDGGGTNNANFATPADGSNPRMQMYLWTQSTPNRDGDLDSDIVWHEYGHGLTWRMIGSMSGPLAGAIGEGMSDTLSIYINRNDVVGEYSYNRAGGIRRYAYTNYPLTYGDVAGSSVHSDGEIYAATMWKLLELWETAGYGQDELFDYVVDGMNVTPARPDYEAMRDGILAAAPTQAQDCIVWEAFAEFGIGVNADGRESCLGRFCNVSITEDFTVPSACAATDPTPAAPSNLTATAASNQINLAWTDNSGNETGFVIQRCTGAGCTNFDDHATVAANTTSYGDTPVAENTTYGYRVRAFNGAGISAYSNTVSVATGAAMHIGDLDGTRAKNGNGWRATVTVTAHDTNHNPVAGAAVTGSWTGSAGYSSSGSCTTGTDGRCSIMSSRIPNSNATVTFAVTAVTKSGSSYSAGSNHDPDGDSNGTSVVIPKLAG